jgi:lambda family phage minor tail protein L
MTSTDKVKKENQKLTPDALVELFQLDLNPIGEPTVYYFTKEPLNSAGDPIVFDGQAYYAVDMESEGWEFTGTGPFPQPTIRISNVFGFLSGALAAANDLIGATLTRTRTYAKFLDSGSDPDPDATFPLDVYTVFQKKSHNLVYIEFILAALVDQQGLTLPKRKILRDTCTHTYRVWNGTSFDYSKCTCPYTGSDMFTKNDVATTDQSKDECSRELTGCNHRFRSIGDGVLPTRAFPGVVRTKL